MADIGDAVTDVIRLAPDTVLCSFLLVSVPTKKLALEECKRRSPFPHLWDVSWDKLSVAVHASDNRALRIAIHADYCLCAYIGVTSASGLTAHMTYDLYKLTSNMWGGFTSQLQAGTEHVGCTLLTRAAQLGLKEVYDDLIIKVTPDHDTANAIANSMHPGISNNKLRKKCLYNLIRKRNLRGLQTLKPRRLPGFVIDCIAVWVVRQQDAELFAVLRDKIYDFDERVTHEINYVSIPREGFPHPYGTTMWTLQDIEKTFDRYKIPQPSRFLGVDDPSLVHCIKNEREHTKRYYLADFENTVRRSLCTKMIAVFGDVEEPPIRDFDKIIANSPQDYRSKSLIIALIRSANHVDIAEFVRCKVNEDFVINMLPNGRAFLRELFTGLAESCSKKLAEYD